MSEVTNHTFFFNLIALFIYHLEILLSHIFLKVKKFIMQQQQFWQYICYGKPGLFLCFVIPRNSFRNIHGAKSSKYIDQNCNFDDMRPEVGYIFKTTVYRKAVAAKIMLCWSPHCTLENFVDLIGVGICSDTRIG